MKIQHETLLIDGPVGAIELRLKVSKEVGGQVDCSKVVVISHPHPLYGGTMNNKVVTTLERAFASRGYTTIAYNFRGVGCSEGEYDNGEGEQQDLLAVVNWAKDEFSPSNVVLAGFSFGSYVSLKSVKASKADALCTVAPPVGLYDFSKIEQINVPWVLIQGGQDEVICAKEVLDWSMDLATTPDIYWRDGASHFFHGELVWLKKVIELGF
ncbi:alpha/beta hydrolase [Thiomicrorhabdus immobilis]|uniref:Alpha/beta hydrolase n=1 Tax=Thiomicrorhabdus immobilis TaxID=2791037 RepID=A0ABM7MEY8_9GAMM|nr:alpha/beta fold hydrolase [Thiomicrorhabdus immobilis]BCN93982.1 alpha/beta hydrolase [Thiomicrorhabdus immobilis]